MFRCVVLLAVPLKSTGEQSDSPMFFPIAQYEYDPGLQIGDEVQITNWKIGYSNDQPFTFTASVIKRVKEIKPQKPQDAFEISIILEMADKDELPRIVEIFKKLNPGEFDNNLY